MFRNCCGCKKVPKISKDKSHQEILSSSSSSSKQSTNTPNKTNELPILDTIEEARIVKEEPIIKQPNLLCPTESLASEIKIEISDNDDDDVFSEGIGPPIKLAQNLGIQNTRDRGHVPLPKWFSEEDENVERGGTLEPLATPIGRDEVALRRHRFFSELLSFSQSTTQHRVRFDPLGPIIAGANNTETPQSNELEALISRLENVTTRLEQVCCKTQEIINQSCHQSIPSSYENFTSSETEEKFKMSVQAFGDILRGPFAQYLSVSKEIGGDVAKQSDIVNQAFQAQLQYLTLASESKQPSQTEQVALLQPTSQQISGIQDFREKNRTSPFFNHLSAISESIPALGWVAVNPAPAPFVKELNDAGQFYTNRVLKDWKEKDKKHVSWVKAWIETLTDLQSFVKRYHTTGLVWGGKTAAAAAAVPPPPPPGCPPPPPLFENVTGAGGDASNDRSALFAQINQGEKITSGLKKVTADMQTHKNTTLRTGPAPFKAPAATSISQSHGTPIDKPPSFVRDGKKWLIEYQKGNQDLLIQNAEMNNVVYLFKCSESTLIVKGKINSIVIDSCKKTSVVFDSLVSSCEFINCQSVQMQVFGKVPTISIDKTDGCQMYLNEDSLDVEIVSSKSSEMNVLVPTGNGDYNEYPLPEQYKTTVVPGGKGLTTTVVESKG